LCGGHQFDCLTVSVCVLSSPSVNLRSTCHHRRIIGSSPQEHAGERRRRLCAPGSSYRQAGVVPACLCVCVGLAGSDRAGERRQDWKQRRQSFGRRTAIQIAAPGRPNRAACIGRAPPRRLGPRHGQAERSRTTPREAERLRSQVLTKLIRAPPRRRRGVAQHRAALARVGLCVGRRRRPISGGRQQSLSGRPTWNNLACGLN
jgi:hypothetical protein